MTRDELLSLALERYGDAPEFLWADSPDTCILRHPDNRKWYAVIMPVPRARLGLPGEGAAWLCNVKCGRLLGGSFLGRPGFLPAYHMNKEHWISLVLDGGAPDDDIAALLELSWSLTRPKARK